MTHIAECNRKSYSIVPRYFLYVTKSLLEIHCINTAENTAKICTIKNITTITADNNAKNTAKNDATNTAKNM